MIMVVVVLHRLAQDGVMGDAVALCVASEREQSYVRNAGYTIHNCNTRIRIPAYVLRVATSHTVRGQHNLQMTTAS